MAICQQPLSCSSRDRPSVPDGKYGLLLIPNHFGSDWTLVAAARGAKSTVEMQEPLVPTFTDAAYRGPACDLAQGSLSRARPFGVFERRPDPVCRILQVDVFVVSRPCERKRNHHTGDDGCRATCTKPGVTGSRGPLPENRDGRILLPEAVQQ